MRLLNFVAFPLAISTAGAMPVLAQGVHVTRPLPGYQCMSLNLSEAQMESNTVQVPILAQPTKTGRPVGTAASVVLAKSPLHEVSGYAEIMRLDGHPGWVAGSYLKPWRSLDGSPGECVPAVMSNGRYGFFTRN
jgi:hypothetical protein